MDYQNRVGSKKGGGGLASSSAQNAHRRERLRQLALETIDLDKGKMMPDESTPPTATITNTHLDPYLFKNHVGVFECRLCLTTHVTDGSYLAHTQGKKHTTNLAQRQALDEKQQRQKIDPHTGLPVGAVAGASAIPIRKTVKIGRPGYKITKVRDPVTRQVGLQFQIKYPEIGTDVIPRYRFMSAFEQKVDIPQNRNFQYLLVAAEPYETCGFKLEANEIDRSSGKFWTYYDKDTKEYFLQLFFRNKSRP